MPISMRKAGRWLIQIICLIYAGLITLASLMPGRFIWDLAILSDRWHSFIHSVLIGMDGCNYRIRDMLANFLLFLPWGMLVPLAVMPSPRQCIYSRMLAWWSPALGLSLALILELAQITLINRNPDVWDVLMGTLGYEFGWLIARQAITRCHLGPEWFLGSCGLASREQVACVLRLFYICFFILGSLVPLEPIWDRGLLIAKFNGGPSESGFLWLSLRAPWSTLRVFDVLVLGLLMIPWGFLSRLMHPVWNVRCQLACLVQGCLILAFMEFAQFFLVNRTSDVAQVLVGILGVMFGSWLSGLWLSQYQNGYALKDTAFGMYPLALAGLAHLIMLFGFSFWPFHIFRPFGVVLNYLRHIESWVPLRNYIQHRPMDLWPLVYANIGWFIPLGFLIGTWLHGTVLSQSLGWIAFAWTMACIIVLAFFCWLGRFLFQSAYADSSDLLCHVIGGLVGYGIGRLLNNSTRLSLEAKE